MLTILPFGFLKIASSDPKINYIIGPFRLKKIAYTVFILFRFFFQNLFFEFFFSKIIFPEFLPVFFIVIFYTFSSFIFEYFFQAFFWNFFLAHVKFFWVTCEKNLETFLCHKGNFFYRKTFVFFLSRKKKFLKKNSRKKFSTKNYEKEKLEFRKKKFEKKNQKKTKETKILEKKIEKKVGDGRCNFLQTIGTIYVIYPKDVECNFSNPQGSFI